MKSHKYLLLKTKLVKKVFLKLTVLKAQNWRNQIDESFPLLCYDTHSGAHARAHLYFSSNSQPISSLIQNISSTTPKTSPLALFSIAAFQSKCKKGAQTIPVRKDKQRHVSCLKVQDILYLISYPLCHQQLI